MGIAAGGRPRTCSCPAAGTSGGSRLVAEPGRELAFRDRSAARSASRSSRVAEPGRELVAETCQGETEQHGATLVSDERRRSGEWESVAGGGQGARSVDLHHSRESTATARTMPRAPASSSWPSLDGRLPGPLRRSAAAGPAPRTAGRTGSASPSHPAPRSHVAGCAATSHRRDREWGRMEGG